MFYHQVKLYFFPLREYENTYPAHHISQDFIKFLYHIKIKIHFKQYSGTPGLLASLFTGKKSTPGFTQCPDKRYASSFSKLSLFPNPNPPLSFDVLIPNLFPSSPQADLSLSENLLPLRMITPFLFSGHPNTDEKLKLKRLAN